MWRWLWLLLLAGCASPAWEPGVAPFVPAEVVLEGTQGALVLRVGTHVAWRLTPLDDWLTASPASGLGPRTVALSARFAREIEEQPEIRGTLLLSGDVQARIVVRLPLVRVEGRVEEGSPAPQAWSPAGPRTEPPSGPAGEVLVKYRTSPPVLPQGVQVLAHDRINRLTKLKAAEPQALLERLRSDPGVAWAEPNGQVQVQGEPTDQYYPEQWYLRATGARFAYLQSYSTPVTVAVVDTGVRYDHPDLAGRLWRPGEGAYDFVGDGAQPCDEPQGDAGDPDPTDPCDQVAQTGGSHGTHVTGIIVANSGSFTPPCPTCSSSGIVGMAYNAPVKVLPLRVLGPRGSGTFENVALAIRYAAGIPVEKGGRLLINPRPAQVINLSLGSLVYSQAMCEAVAEAVDRGVLVVAAAGNFQREQPGRPVYPAACPGAIAVAATDRDNRVAPYSQQNSAVGMAAPGGNTGGGILSTTWDYTSGLPNYSFYIGTSQATPQVAAALAMLMAAGRSPTEAWTLLRENATDLGPPGRDDAYGYGFLNLPAAFGWVLPRGGFLVDFRGPMERLVPAPTGAFSTYLLPGSYTLRACRDDSGNGLCDPNEPWLAREVQVSGRGPLELGTLVLP
ncbi:peptidase S8 and S53 subtilisin kexin sedolisin [Meiothermus sp. QL-1]|uniref:S8 family serine peptidase n=1 Tax=Meiothermus sp. QL-1 TaxID=2058095 RepID=UPI000E0BE032|nr:S8 family serine peptidase [Meiothermus sp. QL-1]RDI94820.1 peptidase S8 and S53 subtilisin kexin sedolisin [Meiothermus sp. QL-1]